MIPVWAAVCGYAAATFSIVSALTQGTRVLRARSAVGIATASWLIGSLASISWFAYGISVRSPQQIVANGSWMYFVGVLTWFMLRPRSIDAARRGIAVAFAVFAVMVAIGVVAPSAPGWVGTVCSMMMTTPQVIHTLRHGRGPGISVPGWVFLTLSTYLWLAYGIGAHEVPVIVNTVVGSVLATAVVVALIIRPHAADPDRISVAA